MYVGMYACMYTVCFFVFIFICTNHLNTKVAICTRLGHKIRRTPDVDAEKNLNLFARWQSQTIVSYCLDTSFLNKTKHASKWHAMMTGDWSLPAAKQGLVVLGSPVGTREFIAATLEEARAKHAALFARLQDVPASTQQAHLPLCIGGFGVAVSYRTSARGVLGVVGGHHRGAQGVPPAGAGGPAAPDARGGICHAAKHQGGRVHGCMAAPAGF